MRSWQFYLKHMVAWTGITGLVSNVWSLSQAASEQHYTTFQDHEPVLGHINQVDPKPMTFTIPVNDEINLLIAGHRSHRSHSSHRSHYSSSGGGGYYSGGYSSSYSSSSSSGTSTSHKTTTTRKTTSKKPSFDLTSAKTTPKSTTKAASTGKAPISEPEVVPSSLSQCEMSNVGSQPSTQVVRVMRVQLELLRLGYYCGMIGGTLGPATKDALLRFQEQNGLSQTGEMDEATLKRLNISY